MGTVLSICNGVQKTGILLTVYYLSGEGEIHGNTC